MAEENKAVGEPLKHDAESVIRALREYMAHAATPIHFVYGFCAIHRLSIRVFQRLKYASEELTALANDLDTMTISELAAGGLCKIFDSSVSRLLLSHFGVMEQVMIYTDESTKGIMPDDLLQANIDSILSLEKEKILNRITTPSAN